MSISKLVFFDGHEPEFDETLTDPAKCLKGQPLQRTWHHFTSADDKFFAGVWEAEPGCWKVNYTENEFCRILSGHSLLRDESGNEMAIGPETDFVIPAGFSGEWEVLETTRKIYVIYQP